jgi:hypothetical protein
VRTAVTSKREVAEAVLDAVLDHRSAVTTTDTQRTHLREVR